MEKYCDNLATEYFSIDLGGLIFLIPMCEEHFLKVIEREDLKNGKN